MATDWKEQLAKLREQIDAIDGRLIPLFGERMEVSRQVAEIKGRNNLPILNAEREEQVAQRAAELAGPPLQGEAALLMRTIMALSREYQHSLLFSGEAPLLPEPRPPVTEHAVCAYQGLPGAWSEQAAMKLFPAAERIHVEYFEDVFLAVKEGKAHYGVVPIENSQTGAIGETYDLLRKYGLYITGRVWIDIRQCLLAPVGTELSHIREVHSHPEALKQCRHYLNARPWNLNACRNTAVAARLAAESTDGKTAAIGSRLAAEINGLQVLAADIEDSHTNRTSFVVVAAQPEYSAESGLISVTFSTSHRSGALCESLLPFMAQNLNLVRIESRPSSGGKYRFFAEIEGNIRDAATVQALRQAASASEYFEVIGCYSSME
ncbi:chorismate mutase [Ruminococcaceae bacterium OttesenSCG-928-L11]|nr:chorismate mutase [Ruminococcaceae bacterium OttesenSCG-928-L11]